MMKMFKGLFNLSKKNKTKNKGMRKRITKKNKRNKIKGG